MTPTSSSTGGGGSRGRVLRRVGADLHVVRGRVDRTRDALDNGRATELG
ncbi:hypothetical protein AB0M92_17110 [Streptomyces sp. NPDC051582]